MSTTKVTFKKDVVERSLPRVILPKLQLPHEFMCNPIKSESIYDRRVTSSYPNCHPKYGFNNVRIPKIQNVVIPIVTKGSKPQSNNYLSFNYPIVRDSNSQSFGDNINKNTVIINGPLPPNNDCRKSTSVILKGCQPKQYNKLQLAKKFDKILSMLEMEICGGYEYSKHSREGRFMHTISRNSHNITKLKDQLLKLDNDIIFKNTGSKYFKYPGRSIKEVLIPMPPLIRIVNAEIPLLHIPNPPSTIWRPW